jgi:nucleoside-diphosphate-sugar epimerase
VRVLVTGAAGFIGAHVVAQALSERDASGNSHDVYALVRPSTDLHRLQALAPAARLVHGDLLDLATFDETLREIRPELVIHCGWYVTPGKYLTSEANFDFVAASVRLARRLADLGCRRFVALGTCFEYDTSVGYLSEETPTRPASPYAASKLALQLMLDQVSALTGMEVAWARIFYQYGPFEQAGRLVPAIIQALLNGQEARSTGGEQTRDFLHIEDVASAIWAIATSPLTGPVNVGSGRPVAVREIVTTIGEILGRPDLLALGAIPYSPSDPWFVCANNRRLVQQTGWAPRYSLEAGLRQTIGWWQGQQTSR